MAGVRRALAREASGGEFQPRAIDAAERSDLGVVESVRARDRFRLREEPLAKSRVGVEAREELFEIRGAHAASLSSLRPARARPRASAVRARRTWASSSSIGG